nr:nucleotide-binding, alpha-beta plait [Tanacetum cinerariifolium]
MAMISAFSTIDKMAHNSRKFAFTLSPTNYSYWKTMIEPFLITNNFMGYVNGLISCLSETLSVTDCATVPKENPNYSIWVSNDAHVCMLIIFTISKALFRHVQGTTSRDLWLSFEKVYAPHSTSRKYTLKTQLLIIEMHSDETPDAYLNCAQEYADALATISEPVKDKDLVMLVVLGIRKEYNRLKTTITARQSLTTFSELHALLSDHDYMLGKTRAPAPSITLSFVENYAVGSQSMPEARQAQLSELTAQLSALGFQVLSIAPFGPQAFYGVRPSNNRNNNNNNHGNRNNSRGNNNRGHDTRANSHVTPDLEAIDNSEAYYGDDALHVGNATSPPPSKTSPYYSSKSPYVIPTTNHPSPSSPRSLISSPSSVSHLSPTSQTSSESYYGQPSPVPYNPSTNHATILPTTITEPTSFIVANNSLKWRQAMKEDYDALMKNETWSLVHRASNTNVVDGKWVYRPYKFERLSKALFDLGFKGSKMDPSLFIYSCGDTLLYILVYVDHIIIIGNNKGTIYNIICQLGFDFVLKDLRPLNYFLGIEIVLHVSGILLSQKKYTLELLQSVGLSNYNLMSSPMVTLSSLSLDDSNLDTSLESFSNDDWTGDLDDRRSTGGFAIYLGSNLIS